MILASTPATQAVAAVLCGGFVSFSLGLVGGGGSILAVPLILYVVGVHNPHIAIGTAALAVAVSAYINMIPHARAGHVRWGPAFAFAASGVLGATLGSSVGKLIDGQRLLTYFAFVMCFVAFLMLRPRPSAAATGDAYPTPYPRLCGTGLGAGSLSGFFGIGGGFLVVPGLMFAGRMQIVDAIGTSLFAVGSFGLTTAINYSLSGQVDWLVAAEFVGGGVVGGLAGAQAASRLARKRGALNRVFSAMIISVAAYMLYHSWQAR
ncbi:putative membrane transporter protein (plasmid) [Caballeronia sp. SBC1]|uniref:sulfite exporter TauE/SafE family protein n=1 Tax=unclassified Caballeronia TaxID=2646786 RepID=UPI0013E0FA5A|nr:MULTISPECIES: sulfite exporter TauE/SafE family protein [unclassified Caballeronia]QIE26098.1 putative membrane transporter protein [Caballeronia sp. SBC2]QIN64589.1 putative membrane transporter protein [Caballeronia sp. SBC1]